MCMYVLDITSMVSRAKVPNLKGLEESCMLSSYDC